MNLNLPKDMKDAEMKISTVTYGKIRVLPRRKIHRHQELPSYVFAVDPLRSFRANRCTMTFSWLLD